MKQGAAGSRPAEGGALQEAQSAVESGLAEVGSLLGA